MVLVYTSNHSYDFDFATASLAHFNRYPNPFSSHVDSADTVRQFVDDQGRLHTERLIRKKGRLPEFVKPFLGKISQSWILETTIVDPRSSTLESCSRNLDHTRVLKVVERSTYTAQSLNSPATVSNRVSFVSNFGWGQGIRGRIENWSYKRFHQNIAQSRRGMAYVMQQLRERGLQSYRQMQLQFAPAEQ
uniref:ARAD1C37576p n=1 Tax=Blastobotrys adeninivorans TaxID=409370 RepID=A0A060T329_BLAAD